MLMLTLNKRIVAFTHKDNFDFQTPGFQITVGHTILSHLCEHANKIPGTRAYAIPMMEVYEGEVNDSDAWVLQMQMTNCTFTPPDTGPIADSRDIGYKLMIYADFENPNTPRSLPMSSYAIQPMSKLYSR